MKHSPRRLSLSHAYFRRKSSNISRAFLFINKIQTINVYTLTHTLTQSHIPIQTFCLYPILKMHNQSFHLFEINQTAKRIFPLYVRSLARSSCMLPILIKRHIQNLVLCLASFIFFLFSSVWLQAYSTKVIATRGTQHRLLFLVEIISKTMKYSSVTVCHFSRGAFLFPFYFRQSVVRTKQKNTYKLTWILFKDISRFYMVANT